MSITPSFARFGSGGKPVGISAARRVIKLMPEGGTSGYNCNTNPVIRIDLPPSVNFLDTHSSYLSFRIRTKQGTVDHTKECRMDRNSMSWVRTFTIYSASGAQIEHIDHYNLLVNLLHKATSPHGYSESIGQMIDNTGNRAVRNGAMAHPRGSQYNSGFDGSGLLSGKTKLLPLGFMQGPLTLELTLAPMNECFVYTPASGQQQAEYQIDNVEYVCNCLSFSEQYNATFAQQLRTRGVDLSFDSYKTHVTTLPDANTVSLSISQNASSVKGFYSILRDAQKYQSREHDSLSEYKSGNISEYQCDLGGRLFPEMPIKLKDDGITQLFSHSLQAWNMFRNIALDTQIGDTNFASTEGRVPNGNPTGSYTALPVRRVYGTFCCNGPDVYDKRHITFAADGEVAQGGEYIKMALANGATYNGATLVGAHDVEFTNWVTTLTFVPHDARDIHLIEKNMRCKMGTAEMPAEETTLAANFDIQSASEDSNQFMNLTSTKVNAVHANGHIVANAAAATGGAERTTALGLDRYFKATPAQPYRKTSTVSGSENTGVVDETKNNNYEHNSKNILFAGSPSMVAWGHPGVAGTVDADDAINKTGIKERHISGLGVSFVDGSNRPVLSRSVGVAFEGWVDCVPDDSAFYLSSSLETFAENPGLVSGSDLSTSVPLQLRLTYEGTQNEAQHFFEGKTTSDPMTTFVHTDNVLRLTPSGEVISSV